MIRYPDWQGRLDRFILANVDRPFVWGMWDCAMLTAGAIEAVTGVDIAADWRGSYATEAGAIALCQKVCGEPSWEAMAAYVARQNEMKEVPPSFAQRGDMVMTSVCLGVVGLNSQVWVLTETGLSSVEYRHIQRAWRVG